MYNKITQGTTYMNINLNLEEIAEKGESIYVNKLKNKLEKSHVGDYVVIEVGSENYFVDKNLKVALDKAQNKYPEKIFHIIRIGSIQKSFKKNLSRKNGWVF